MVQYDYFLLDMDGVLIRGKKPIETSIEAVRRIKRAGHKVVVLTNNAIHSERNLATKLRDMGYDITPDEIFSSITALREYLREHPIETAFPVASLGVIEALVQMNVSPFDSEDVDAVVVSFDKYVTYSKLERATKAILKGAKFIATNPDPSIVTEDGLARPGAGAIVGSIEIATGVKPIVLGKPSGWMIKLASHHYGFDRSMGVMVGDRISTDIAAAENAGVDAVLVLTGATKEEDVPDDFKHPVYPDLLSFLQDIGL